jgi:hypothetical protein
MLTVVIRCVAVILCIAGATGAIVAYKHNQPILGIKLFALVGAALPAAVFPGRFAAVLVVQSKTTWIVVSILGILLLCAFAAAIFPKQFFQTLAHLTGHDSGPR